MSNSNKKQCPKCHADAEHLWHNTTPRRGRPALTSVQYACTICGEVWWSNHREKQEEKTDAK